MGLGSVSASKDVIGDPSRKGTTNIYYWHQCERKGRKCWNAGRFPFLPGRKKTVVYGGKRCVFRPERNVGRVGQERSETGNEFQIVGAAKVNEWRPFAERMSGTEASAYLGIVGF